MKVFLIYEPAEMTEPVEITKVVGAVLADSIEEAASSTGGKLEKREKKESIVWLPEKNFVEVWQGKKYPSGKTPDDVEKGFEDLLWQITPTKTISLGLISPLVDRKKGCLGLAIREIPLLPSLLPFKFRI